DLFHFGKRAGGLLEAAAAAVADEDVAALPLAQEQVGVAALRTGLRDRTRGEREVAGGIVDAAIEGAEPPAPLRNDPAVLGAADAGVFDGLGRLVLAGRIPAAGDVGAEAAVPAHERVAGLGAHLAGGLVGPRLGLSPGHDDVDDVAALGVRRAAEKRRSRPALPQLHRRAAFLAHRALELRRVHDVFVRVGDVLGEGALGIPAARD